MADRRNSFKKRSIESFAGIVLAPVSGWLLDSGHITSGAFFGFLAIILLLLPHGQEAAQLWSPKTTWTIFTLCAVIIGSVVAFLSSEASRAPKLSVALRMTHMPWAELQLTDSKLVFPVTDFNLDKIEGIMLLPAALGSTSASFEVIVRNQGNAVAEGIQVTVGVGKEMPISAMDWTAAFASPMSNSSIALAHAARGIPDLHPRNGAVLPPITFTTVPPPESTQYRTLFEIALEGKNIEPVRLEAWVYCSANVLKPSLLFPATITNRSAELWVPSDIKRR